MLNFKTRSEKAWLLLPPLPGILALERLQLACKSTSCPEAQINACREIIQPDSETTESEWVPQLAPAPSCSLLFSCSFVSASLCGLQHTRLPCPSLSPGIHSNSCPLSRRCHPTISSSRCSPQLFQFSHCLPAFHARLQARPNQQALQDSSAPRPSPQNMWCAKGGMLKILRNVIRPSLSAKTLTFWIITLQRESSRKTGLDCRRDTYISKEQRKDLKLRVF